MKVEHFNHGMYSNTNKVTLSDIESTIAPTTLAGSLTLDEATSVSVASTTNFTTFEEFSSGHHLNSSTLPNRKQLLYHPDSIFLSARLAAI